TLVTGGTFAGTNIIRGPVDPNYPDLPGPIEVVLLRTENFGDLRTSGFDAGFKWRAPATAFAPLTFGLDGPYISKVAVPGAGEVAGHDDGPSATRRWRHYASVDWTYGAWTATMAQVYQHASDEFDQRLRCDESGCPPRRVGSYSAWNLQGQYTGFRN